MALAREQEQPGSSSPAGLTLFYVPVRRDEQGRPEASVTNSGRGTSVAGLAVGPSRQPICHCCMCHSSLPAHYPTRMHVGF